MNVNIVWSYLITLYYWSIHMIFVFSYHFHYIYSINLECTLNTIMYFSCWFISPYLVHFAIFGCSTIYYPHKRNDIGISNNFQNHTYKKTTQHHEFHKCLPSFNNPYSSYPQDHWLTLKLFNPL